MTDSVVQALQDMFPSVEVLTHSKMGLSGPSSGATPGHQRGIVPTILEVPIELDSRIERMVRLAILSSPAVILVGPPGTGKTTFLKQVIDSVAADPQAYGFENGLNGAVWATPQESWTTTDLVGGTTVEHGELKFRPGLVLDAIKADQWLVLDEVNRADMDRIFGGLLTWLSGQEVTVGTVSPALNAAIVQLGWSNEAASLVEGEEALSGDSAGVAGEVRYLAGEGWRLLGTYNAIDAQRVFRFGHALGRRFLRVPIPAPDAAQFKVALDNKGSELSESVKAAIVNLYEAHKRDASTTLGPAMFLRMVDYVLAGTASRAEALAPDSAQSGVVTPDAGLAPPDSTAGSDSTPVSLPEEADTATSSLASKGLSAIERELLAEAYLVNIGTWLSDMEDSATLGEAIVRETNVFSQGEWEWIRSLSRDLA